MTSPIRARSGGPTCRCGEDGRNLVEVFGAEQSGGDDAKYLRVNVAVIVEVVHRSTPDAQCVAWSHVNGRAVDRPSRNALEAVHRLFEDVMTMRGRPPAPRLDTGLEDRRAPSGIAARDEEPHRRVADSDHFAPHARHASQLHGHARLRLSRKAPLEVGSGIAYRTLKNTMFRRFF